MFTKHRNNTKYIPSQRQQPVYTRVCVPKAAPRTARTEEQERKLSNAVYANTARLRNGREKLGEADSCVP